MIFQIGLRVRDHTKENPEKMLQKGFCRNMGNIILKIQDRGQILID